MLQVTDTNAPARRIALADNAPTEVITATGVGADTVHRIPVVLFRRTADRTTFAWSLSLDGPPPAIEVTADTDTETRLRIATAAGAWQARIVPAQGLVELARP